MVRPLEISLRWLLSLLIAMTVGSCSSPEEGDIPLPEPGDGRAITFKFRIHTSDGSPSRAPGVWEEDAVDIAERILSIEDLRVLLFDQSGVLLKSVIPSYLDYKGGTTANDGYYTLSVAFTHDYFDKFADDADVPFTVMILANLHSAGGEYITYSPGVTRVADIAEFFRLSPEYIPTATGGIPMYGIKGFVLPKSLLTQGLDAPSAGEIDMLRSLCKIEVSDKIANSSVSADGERYPRVTAVEMVAWADHGYLRPAFDDYPAGLKYANIHPAPLTGEPMSALPAANGLYRLYCPEAATKDVRFRVTALLEPGGEPRQFEIGLERFSGEIGRDLVRNHIYRFDVHALNTIADLTVTVSDWNVKTDEFELDNIVSMEPDGFLEWEYDSRDFAVTTETYNGTLEEQLSILNGSTAYATGRFHIISPKGATWKAYFIPGENGVDAFEFVDVDPDGNPVAAKVFAEGPVGEEAVIRVRGKGLADPYRHWAELVVEVRTVDGNIIYAPLTSRMSSRFIIYRENRM